MEDANKVSAVIVLALVLLSFTIYMFAINMRTNEIFGYLHDGTVIMINGEEATGAELTVAIPHIKTYEYDEENNTLIVEVK